MRKLATLGLAAALAAAGVGLTAVPGAADHWRYRDSGVSFGFSFGGPRYYYDDYSYRRVYRPYRTYRYVVPQRPRVIVRDSNWEAHVAWCYERYRSYRSSDNTFQPFNGPRRECYSPYYG